MEQLAAESLVFTDLSESHDVSAQHPDRVAQMKTAMLAWRVRMGVAGISGCR